ncbi:hypothetical protein CHUAL_002071 [Chamberlinius hualienensis]
MRSITPISSPQHRSGFVVVALTLLHSATSPLVKKQRTIAKNFKDKFKISVKKIKNAWETFREIIPPCTERDEALRFAKKNREPQRTTLDSVVNGDDTEMASLGRPIGVKSDYTTFGNEQETVLNGDLIGAEGDGYELADEAECGEFGDPRHKISEWQAGWNVTNAIQGMFIVSLPYAVKNGGYWGIFSMVFVAYICCHTGKILVECLYETDERGEKVRVRDSYVAIAEVCFGAKYGGKMVNCAQMIELLMTCILYVVLCGDLMIGSFPNGALDQRSWMMLCGILILPCAFLKTLRSVSFLSFWNTVVHLIINIMIVGYCLSWAGQWGWGQVQIKLDIYKFPISMGIVVFSYTSHIFLPTLEGCLEDRSKFNCMLDWSHVAAALFKALFAYIAFLTWTIETEDVITNNLTAVELLERNFFRGPPTTRFPHCFALDGMLKVWALGLKLALIFFTIMMAISIPHFAILMGFIGSFTGTMLSFVWPAYFHLRLKWDTLQWYEVSLDVFIICLGGVCGLIGIYYSGRALQEAYHIPLPHIKIGD